MWNQFCVRKFGCHTLFFMPRLETTYKCSCLALSLLSHFILALCEKLLLFLWEGITQLLRNRAADSNDCQIFQLRSKCHIPILFSAKEFFFFFFFLQFPQSRELMEIYFWFSITLKGRFM